MTALKSSPYEVVCFSIHHPLFHLIIDMSSIAVSRPINPAGKAPLTQDQVWKGLGVKAREPLKFVKMIKACEVVEDETTKGTMT